jgi:hypothetical protein
MLKSDATFYIFFALAALCAEIAQNIKKIALI